MCQINILLFLDVHLASSLLNEKLRGGKVSAIRIYGMIGHACGADNPAIGELGAAFRPTSPTRPASWQQQPENGQQLLPVRGNCSRWAVMGCWSPGEDSREICRSCQAIKIPNETPLSSSFVRDFSGRPESRKVGNLNFPCQVAGITPSNLPPSSAWRR